MLRRSRVWALSLLAGSLAVTIGEAPPAWADEPIFGFVYTTDLLPKGKSEVEQWLTLRTKRPWGDFNVLEGKTEYSFGVTDAFQLSAYLNYAWTDVFKNSVDRKTQPPESFAEQTVDEDRRFSKAKFVGVSAEGIWRLLSPYTDPVGLAILLEPGRVFNIVIIYSLRATGDVRAFDGKGRHTTSSSELFELAGGTRVIDTPGVRAFALAAADPATARSGTLGSSPQRSAPCIVETSWPPCRRRSSFQGLQRRGSRRHRSRRHRPQPVARSGGASSKA